MFRYDILLHHCALFLIMCGGVGSRTAKVTTKLNEPLIKADLL